MALSGSERKCLSKDEGVENSNLPGSIGIFDRGPVDTKITGVHGAGGKETNFTNFSGASGKGPVFKGLPQAQGKDPNIGNETVSGKRAHISRHSGQGPNFSGLGAPMPESGGMLGDNMRPQERQGSAVPIGGGFAPTPVAEQPQPVAGPIYGSGVKTTTPIDDVARTAAPGGVAAPGVGMPTTT